MSSPDTPDTAQRGWWSRRRERRREERRRRRVERQMRERRTPKTPGTCKAPRCWARAEPDSDYCGLHGRL